MFFLKKIIAKRVIRKNAKEVQNVVKRAYKDLSRDLNRRMNHIKAPLKITISR
jgi:hypothetical protein